MTRGYTSARRTNDIYGALGLSAFDAIAMLTAFIAAYRVRALRDRPFAHYVSFLDFCRVALMLTPVCIVVFALFGLYSPRHSQGRVVEAVRVSMAVSMSVMLLIVASYLDEGMPLFPGKSVPLYALVFGVVFVLVGRECARQLMRLVFASGHGLHSVILVGTGPLAERLAAELMKPGLGNRIVAVVSERGVGQAFAGNLPVYASLETAMAAHAVRIDEVVQADLDMDRDAVVALMSLASTNGIAYRFVPDEYGVYAAASTLSSIGGQPVMELRLTTLDGWGAVGKRCFDLVSALILLVLLTPLLVTLALMLKITDREGPVLYRQTRLGRSGRPIGVFKFRSMTWAYCTGPDRPFKTAVEVFDAMGRSDLSAEFVLEEKVADDPRVSALGQFMRRTSLDELPQLFNVILGQLSLVGPRPITPAELERYGSQRASFLALKPGMTGLWQVSGRSDTTYDERVKLDVFYSENWSPQLDLAILARTVVTVAARRGAV